MVVTSNYINQSQLTVNSKAGRQSSFAVSNNQSFKKQKNGNNN